jgi:3-aminobutyryl-CoA ammonia-lyase
VFTGDYIEVIGTITRVGKTSRDMEFEARKVIQPLPVERGGLAVSSAELLDSPIVVCRARGTCVTPVELQRHSKK